MAVPLKGLGSMGVVGSNVSTVLTTGSPAFGLFMLPPLSRKTLNDCANLVSRNSRSPTAVSAPGVPVAATEGGGELLLPLPHPTRRREVKIQDNLPTT